MGAKVLSIKQVSRVPDSGPEEKLSFQPGVNVLVGPPNTGKTKWLRMLDYLMGDPDRPESTFGQGLAEKYKTVAAVFCIGKEEIFVERRWKESGALSKVFIDDSPIPAREFSQFLLDKLQIPVLHYPKGNPFSNKAWPELSWRSLLRHIYRQERFWTDLADKQPEREQHACLMQFLGIAEHLYPNELSNLVEKKRQVFLLQAKKDQFFEMLQTVSRELGTDEAIGVSPTADSIDSSITEIRTKIGELQKKRESVLQALRTQVLANERTPNDAESSSASERLGDTLVRLQEKRDEDVAELSRGNKRLAELERYRKSVEDELSRLERAQSAGEIFADLKATHCPVCDQPVHQTDYHGSDCYLCHQPYQHHENGTNVSSQRLDFEVEQLREELREGGQIIAQLTSDRDRYTAAIQKNEEEIRRVESLLKPLRQAVSAILPPEISVFDQETGRLEEQIRQIRRVKQALELRNNLSKQIDGIEHEIQSLDSEVEKRSENINFAQASDELADGMNTYLNALRRGDPSRWPEGAVQVRLREDNFQLAIAGEKWSIKLGATFQLYFLMAYHHALLSFTGKEGFLYPGLAILDFPPTLADGSALTDKENYIIEPFVALLSRPMQRSAQLISTGRAFEGLEGAHRVELTKVWE